MAARSRSLTVFITGDTDDLERAGKRSTKVLDGLGKQTRLTASISSKGYSVMRAGATGAVGAIAGLAIVGKEVISTATDINESLSKNTVLFGRYADKVEAFSETSATSFGLSKQAALEYTGVFGNLFTALGLSQQKSAGMSVGLTKLAADMASFNNTSIEDALEAIRSGLVGETEPLRKFGVNLNDATLRQQAMSMGLTHTTKNVLTPYQKAMASQALIIKQTEKAHGDFHRTQGGLANQTRILQAEFSDIKGELGEQLLPTVTTGARKLSGFIKEMQDGTGSGGRFVDALEDIGDEVKPVVQWIGRATKNVAEFTSEHPNVRKLALAVIGVGAAVKTLKFVSAATGFTDLLKAGRGAASGLKKVLARGGTAAGEAAAENAADSISKSGRLKNAGRTAGRNAGKAFGVAFTLGAVVGLADIGVSVSRKAKDELGKAGLWNPPGGRGSFWDNLIPERLFPKVEKGQGLAGKLGEALGLFKADGGIVPGTGNRDTVPVMATPGEFVVRKKIVEKFGPTFFAAINDGQAPQLFSAGGIVERANRMDGMHLPYLWGGGHGGPIDKGVDCSGAISYALGVSPRVSGAFMGFGLPGPGKPMDTKIYANPTHIFGVFNGRGWGTSRENPGGGPGWLSYNSRPGFTVRHLNDSGGKAAAGGTVGDPQETVESGKANLTARQERAGSRLVNALVRKDLKGVSALTRGASSLGAAIESADTTYSQTERGFGQTVGGQAGKFGDEDLGTAAGRGARTNELGALRTLKTAQKRRMRRRKAALEKAVRRYEKLIKDLQKARGKAHGAKRVKINERLRSYDDRRIELAGEAKALGSAIKDVELDIGDLDSELQAVAATPDTVPDAGPDAPDAPDLATVQGDLISRSFSDVDLQERAGLLTPEAARAQRITMIQQWLGGALGQLDQRQTWELMAALREAQGDATQAASDLAEEIRGLKDQVAQSNALAQTELAIGLREARRVVADMVSGELGARVGPRSQLPGNGELSRLF